MKTNKKKKNKQKLSTIIKNNLTMLIKIAKYTPGYFIFMIVNGVIWGLFGASYALFSYNLLNAVDESGDFLYALKIILIMAALSLFVYAFDRWYSGIKNPLLRQKLHIRMHEELFVKSHSLDLSCFDDPEFYNDFVWAMNESSTRAVEVLEDTGLLINRILSSLA